MKVNSFILVATFVATFSSISAVYAESQLSLEQRIQQIELQNKTRDQLQAEMSRQLIDLQKNVKELRGIAEEQQFKLQQIQERQRDLYRDIENRLSAAPTSTQSSSTSNNQATPTAQVKPTSQTSVSPVALNSNERSEFENAFNQVRNREYSQAVKGFEAFLKKYPKGAYSDNARFWIGQVYFAQNQLDEAEKQFAKLRTDFPDSPKLSTAMLKQAEIKVKQQKWEEAKALYNQVVNKYSGAQQQLARKGLQDIKSAGY